MTELRAHIAQVLTDYKDGLLDSLEDGVEAIMERIDESLVVVGTMRAREYEHAQDSPPLPQRIIDEDSREKGFPRVGHSVSTGTRSAED